MDPSSGLGKKQIWIELSLFSGHLQFSVSGVECILVLLQQQWNLTKEEEGTVFYYCYQTFSYGPSSLPVLHGLDGIILKTPVCAE